MFVDFDDFFSMVELTVHVYIALLALRTITQCADTNHSKLYW